jgi:hypothetical protein
MRLFAPLPLAVLAALLVTPAFPQEADDSLAIYAVHIDRTPKQQSWIGEGIYLGRGFVLTAAHVAGLGFWRNPRVEIAGQIFPTQVVKDGHFHNIDLTLLSVDERRLPVRLGLRRLALCRAPWIGEPVVVVNSESVGRSEVVSPDLLPASLAASLYAAIRYVPGTGESGSGIFDANTKCLLGIISGKVFRNEMTEKDGQASWEEHDIAKYFVSSIAIAEFIPSEARF